ncbi:triosephosphate isomerase [Nocardiopsis sp. HNM0947]|uniref:Triosephosphate isomerase n=1 Tax=Nocardiopsis coralli TaxID=2772213 RepID=A0ABR9P0N0_9ACTN|nr:triose-phosphate isomerase family protein [Nocardiopsis coralli]MBE2997415.1 triosephosphate isomerase [Nocardiopsis coralli]
MSARVPFPGRPRDPLPAPITGTNTKSLVGLADLAGWKAASALDPGLLSDAGFFMLLPAPLLAPAHDALAGTGVTVGAQDCWWDETAPTGEIAPSLLGEIGCAYAMVGHPERRGLGEDDGAVSAKARACALSGLVPVLCVGEDRYMPAPRAAVHTRAQLDAVLDVCPDDAPLVVMYEPAWTVGAPEPASPDHVGAVAEGLADALHARSGPGRLMYAGAVAPGTVGDLMAAGPLDGVGLGRSAHTRDERSKVLREVLEAWHGKEAAWDAP